MKFRFESDWTWKLRAAVWLSWCLALCGASRTVDAADYGAMANSLVNFPDYIKWPTENASITVGILGDDPFGDALTKVNVKRSKKLEDLKDCQVIFISKSEQANLNSIFESIGSANILTVGESEEFARQGGVIGFVPEGDKYRFAINTGAARRAGLKIDLRLLKIAKAVFNN
jgi:hypothetical protein